MKQTKIRSHDDVCSELRPEDGQDPRLLKRRETVTPRRDREARHERYCRAVQQSLETCFAVGLGDELLNTVNIESVEPTRSGAGMLVIVSAEGEAADLAAIELGLAALAGRLRAEVAHDIRRKRTPMLTFRVVPTLGDL